MKEVLILGNGLSRQRPEIKKFIDNWKGPIWGCNWVYKDVLEGKLHRLDRLIGDKICMKKALPARKRNRKLNFEPICKGYPVDELHECVPAYNLGVERKYVFDSGTTLVHIALLEGYERIYLAGFDLGGKDLYISDHQIRDKSSWIRKWRMLRDEFGLDRIEFLGFDHKPFILSDLPNDIYSRLYRQGENHIRPLTELQELSTIGKK